MSLTENSKQMGRSLKVTSLFFFLFTNVFTAFPQKISERLIVLPFKEGTRPDSLDVVFARTIGLVDARKYYEKSYISRKLVFSPGDSVLFDWSKSDIFFSASESKIQNTGSALQIRERKGLISSARKGLKESINKSNKLIRERNRFRRREIAESPESQTELAKLERADDYELIFVQNPNFIHVDNTDPRENLVSNDFRSNVEQILLGKPYNLYGFINSKNFTELNFDQQGTPNLIKLLLDENLRVAVSLLDDPLSRSKVGNVKLDLQNVSGHQKFWINTDISNRTIYFSPYLIRAIFNISYYQLGLMKLIERSENEQAIGVFLRGKGSATVSQIDDAYFSNFVELFSRNIQFVLGHELAHFYVLSTDTRIKEIDCDREAIRLLSNNFKSYDLGVFETLLIKSIQGNDLDFWGNAIRQDWLIERYTLLKSNSKNF
jgi:predicted Zn-dependent protease with MMP-like domain